MRHYHKLDEATLKRLGFVSAGKDRLDRGIWRLKFPFYHYQFQIALGDYPADNPNCGILSLYQPYEEFKVPKYDDKKKKFKKVKIKMQERIIPIAHYVHTPERLFKIIHSLTQVNL